MQVVGVSVTIISFFLFSTAGHSEGIYWKKNHWIWLIIAATLLGAASALYDKHLLHNYDRMTVQVYSTFYQAALMAVVMALMWWPTHKKTTPFCWRWSIVGISVFLIIADYAYYWPCRTRIRSFPSFPLSAVRELSSPSCMVQPHCMRRICKKAIYLSGVLAGVLFWCLNSRTGNIFCPD